MADLWMAVSPWWQVASAGGSVEAHAVWGPADAEGGTDIWNAAGRMLPVNDPGNNAWGLEGDLHTPTGPYPGWYTPMHLKVLRDVSGKTTLSLDVLGRTQSFSDAQSVGLDYIQEWEYMLVPDGSMALKRVISEITTVRFYDAFGFPFMTLDRARLVGALAHASDNH